MKSQTMTSMAIVAIAALAACAGTVCAWQDPGLDPRVAATIGPQIPVPQFCDTSAAPPGIASAPVLWQGGIVPFEIEGSVANPALSCTAMDVWMFRSVSPNVTFIRRDPANPAHSNYIRIRGVAGSVSSSYIGVCSGCGTSDSGQIVTQGQQVNVYVMAHEYCHALGFDHEQCRPDRDNYVDVWYSRVYPQSYTHNFDITPDWPDNGLSTGYDFDSVMHYGATSFMNPNCDLGFATCLSVLTCTPLVARADLGYGIYQCSMGQQSFLSANDVQDMVNVYGVRPRPVHFVGPTNQALGTLTNPFSSTSQIPGSGDVWIEGGQSYSGSAGIYTAPATWRKHGSDVAIIH